MCECGGKVGCGAVNNIRIILFLKLESALVRCFASFIFTPFRHISIFLFNHTF